MSTEEKAVTISELAKALRNLLDNGADWEALPVSLKGNISLKRLPANTEKHYPAKLGLTFNPLNKRKETYFFTVKELETYLITLKESSKGMSKLLRIIEKLNPEVTETTTKAGLKVF